MASSQPKPQSPPASVRDLPDVPDKEKQAKGPERNEHNEAGGEDDPVPEIYKDASTGNIPGPSIRKIYQPAKSVQTVKAETVKKKCTVGNFFRMLMNYIRRLFSFPLVKDPISFTRPGDYLTTGEYDPGTKFERSSSLEVLCNYDAATKELFEHILKDRKEARAVKDNYHTIQVDLSKFPGWNDTVIDRLRSTFQVFDISGDGLVDFDELSAILIEFGDTSDQAVRKQYFDEVDSESSGAIDFMDFITMIFHITVKNSDPEAQGLADAYRAIDRNMARIRSLDVVQQLQAGLF